MDTVKQALSTAGAWVLDHKKFSGAVLIFVVGFVLAKVL